MSEWEDIYKGVPQGSIWDTVFFKIFINDIFYFIQESSLYNYADDNTLSYEGYNLDQLITVLAEIESRKRSLYPVYPAKKHR
jgi:hypothetical protein